MLLYVMIILKLLVNKCKYICKHQLDKLRITLTEAFKVEHTQIQESEQLIQEDIKESILIQTEEKIQQKDEFIEERFKEESIFIEGRNNTYLKLFYFMQIIHKYKHIYIYIFIQIYIHVYIYMYKYIYT
jgi:hypothetical protein